MTEEKIQGQTGQITTEQMGAAPQPVRRKLLKSTVAIPVIMTLHSGAALAARTSNLVSEVAPRENAVKAQPDELTSEKYVCARPSTDPGIEQPGDGRYDLGGSPVIDYVENLDDCTVPNGILLSSTAYSSLMGIDIPNV